MAIERYAPGQIASKAYTSSGSVDFEFQPRDGHNQVTVFSRPTTAGTVRLYRRDVANNLVALGAAVAVTANNEDSQLIDYPITSSVVVRFTDTSAGAGSVSVEFADNGRAPGAIG